MAYTTINKSSEYFNTKLYTGNATGRTISGVGFQPDWTWIKNRSDTSGHRVLDVVRGGTKELIANGTNAEITEAQSLQSWNSDGFVLGTAAGVNANTDNFVSWNWKANGAGVSNTDGSITSTVSASTTSGFSIIQYTGNGSSGATIGHGLGVVPKVVIVKLTSGSGYDWGVYHASLGNTKNMRLNLTDSVATSTAFWNDTTPSSSLVTLGNNATVNGSGSTYIAYCFAEKKGYSKFGSYTGNGNADGTFIYTGFKPAFVIHKRTDSAGYSWLIHDNKRPDYNSTDKILEADLDNAEQSNYHMDLLSNGFKHRLTAGSTNASGGTYIYMAFAENPLVGTNNIPATAR
jgi:hypothetical protein